MEIEEMYKLQEQLAKYFSNKNNVPISREEIFDALFVVYEDSKSLDWSGDVWDLEIDFDVSTEALAGFNFDALKSPVYTDDIIPSHFRFMETKVHVKNAGRVWIIHRYDADSFPSNPHAHELNENIKLDLSNGKLFRKRKFLHQISKKELLEVRSKASRVFKGDLPELAW